MQRCLCLYRTPDGHSTELIAIYGSADSLARHYSTCAGLTAELIVGLRNFRPAYWREGGMVYSVEFVEFRL